MNMEAVLSGRQSNDVNLNEDGFGARRLRERNVCQIEREGELILVALPDLKDYRSHTSEHLIREAKHSNCFRWLFIVTISRATAQTSDENDD